MKIIDVLRSAVIELRNNCIEDAIIKSRIVLANLLEIRKEELIVNENKELKEDIVKEYLERINKLCNNYPIQYITHEQEFMGEKFFVNENVLIPRQDTEILVETALKHIIKGNVLELCTGSGIISISIAKKIKDINIIATDVSTKALEVAKINAKKHNVNINFIESDIFDKVEGKYDIIVSNPPYIETETIKKLDEQVKKEPVLALDGGKDGLNFYVEIADNAYKYLNKGGYMFLEIGYNQKEKVMNILKGRYMNISCIKDLAGNDRVIMCMWDG